MLHVPADWENSYISSRPVRPTATPVGNLRASQEKQPLHHSRRNTQCVQKKYHDEEQEPQASDSTTVMVVGNSGGMGNSAAALQSHRVAKRKHVSTPTTNSVDMQQVEMDHELQRKRKRHGKKRSRVRWEGEEQEETTAESSSPPVTSGVGGGGLDGGTAEVVAEDDEMTHSQSVRHTKHRSNLKEQHGQKDSDAALIDEQQRRRRRSINRKNRITTKSPLSPPQAELVAESSGDVENEDDEKEEKKHARKRLLRIVVTTTKVSTAEGGNDLLHEPCNDGVTAAISHPKTASKKRHRQNDMMDTTWAGGSRHQRVIIEADCSDTGEHETSGDAVVPPSPPPPTMQAVKSKKIKRHHHDRVKAATVAEAGHGGSDQEVASNGGNSKPFHTIPLHSDVQDDGSHNTAGRLPVQKPQRKRLRNSLPLSAPASTSTAEVLNNNNVQSSKRERGKHSTPQVVTSANSMREACDVILSAMSKHRGIDTTTAASPACATAAPNARANGEHGSSRGKTGADIMSGSNSCSRDMDDDDADDGGESLNMDHIIARVSSYKSMLQNMFENSSTTASHIPVVTKAYEESFMRERVDMNERECVMGAACECNFISKGDSFVGVEFVLPGEQSSDEVQMCVLCHRRTVQSLFYDIVYTGVPFKGVIQRYGNIVGQASEYSRSVALVCPPNGPAEMMPFPSVLHQRNRYTVLLRDNVRCIRQNNMQHQGFQMAPPP